MQVDAPLITASARKHGIGDDDIIHPILVDDLDDGFTMFIGPDQAGNLLEVGVVNSDDGPIRSARHGRPSEVPEVTVMPRTTQEILDHADELAARFEQHEPTDDATRDASALALVRTAFLARAAAERQLVDAVVKARQHGHSWASIGAMVGTSGEAARQRYGQAVSTR